MTKFQLLGAWVGLFGGIGGLIATALQGFSVFQNRPRVKVVVSHAWGTRNSMNYIAISVINLGGKPISVNSVSVEYSNGMHSPLSAYSAEDTQGPLLPFRLDSHSEVSWMISNLSTQEAIKKLQVSSQIKGRVNLATGSIRRSEKLSL